MRRPRAALLFLWLCLALPRTAHAAPDYLTALQTRARAEALSRDAFWHRLLHYRTNWRGQLRSQADGPGFFLAADGASDPEAELQADLAAFFAPDPPEPDAEHPQCAFPARYAWLKGRLGFDPTRLPERACADYDVWRATMDPSGVTLVFASAFLNAPASMYGHTFLRFDRKRYANVDLLANVVSYTASMTPVNPVVYTWKGLTGGFPGVFQALPYYVKVHEYSDLESRDLWEYHLDIPDGGMTWMLRHIWELDHTHFNYYFFDENCAYHILSLLEVGRPDLHLLDAFPTITIPVDTLRAVVDAPGLVKRRTLRRAHTAVMQAQLDHLASGERRLARDLVLDLAGNPLPDVVALPAERRGQVLDAAQSYFQYAYGADLLGAEPEAVDPTRRQRGVALMQARSDVPVRVETVAPPDVLPPERGHRSSRIGLQAGAAGPRPFLQVSARIALHDLLDRQAGYTPDSALEMAALTLRLHAPEPGGDPLDVEAADLFRITSLTPATAVVRMPSWRVALGWGRPPDKVCSGWRCGAAMLTGGPGWAGANHLLGHQVYYAFLDAALAAGPALGRGHRTSLAANVGLLWQWSEAWRLHVEGGATYP
ncbi:MAG TPA: DUF4105 domain-containing protein, partial [Myxococcota bacterium]|nr:DUF4105 domain-containing protein [Myxococcota bacterium]